MNEPARMVDVQGDDRLADALFAVAHALKEHRGPIAIITGGHFPSIHIGDGHEVSRER